MALTPGTRLGVYEVVAQIGVGGMGEVYKATDTNLKRSVAIKVLPGSVAGDAERLARFQREAEVLAALNHPNIAQIFGLEKTPDFTALVMELVEGDDVSQRIARGAIPLDEALPIAKQIAEALEAAHEQGIIHRDLKPANIKVRSDGTVKVLDFGLAKAVGPPKGGHHVQDGRSVRLQPDASMSPTITTPAMMTGAGMILGTAAYMSPEQARGKTVDKRADIWAFGCVLFEMLTGTRAFGGDEVQDTFVAIMRDEPDWARLPATLPPALVTYLRRCLHKNPKQRIPDIAAMRLALEGAFETAAEGPAVDGPAQAGRYVRGEERPLWRRALPPTGAALAAAALVGGAMWFATRPAPPRMFRTEVTTAGATALSMTGADRDLAITTDGSRIVYRGTNQLLVRALDQLEPDVLSGLGAPRGPFVSPDGQWIGFFDGTALKKVAITGGPPVTVVPVDGAGPRGATWGADGTIVYATTHAATGLQRVSAAGGDPTVLTTPDRVRGEGDHFWPEFLPGGQVVLFTVTAATGGLDNAQIAVLDLATGTSKVVVRGGHHAHYVPTGHLVYGAGGTLRAVAFDLGRLEVVGTPVPVLEQVVTTGEGAVDVAVAATGTLVYVPGRGAARAARSLVWADRMGREEPVPAPVRAYQYPRISPDGTRVALDFSDQDLDIWIWDFARLTFTRLTFDPGSDEYPVWMPDSRRVVFGSGPPNAQNLFWKAADGTGSADRLTQSPNDQDAQSVTPDGNLLVFREIGAQGAAPTRSADLMVLPLRAVSPSPGTSASGGGSPLQVNPLIQTSYAEQTAEVSPGGQWLAYGSNESGREEIYVRPFPDVESGRWQVSTGGGRTPLWSRNGQELFYVTPEAVLMGVRVERGPSWRSSVPAKVLECACFLGAAGFGRTFDIAPDGTRFLMIKEDGGTEAAPQNLVVVQNWFEELKRLVPVN